MIQSAVLISLWPVLGWYSLWYRVLASEGYLPLFYILIWLTGKISHPQVAFWTSFLGHILFDAFFFMSPLFIFVWLASGISSWLIAKLRLLNLEIIMVLGMPILFLGAFYIISKCYFPNGQDWWKYFATYPRITFLLIFVNPIFNGLSYWLIIENSKVKHLIKYLNQTRISSL